MDAKAVMNRIRAHFRVSVEFPVPSEALATDRPVVPVSLYLYVRESKKRSLLILLPPNCRPAQLLQIVSDVVLLCVSQFYVYSA